MRVTKLSAAACVLPLAVAIAAPAHAGDGPPPPPPYIDHTEWAHWGELSSLRVYPTPAGRQASTDFVSPDEAWAEVLADAPDGDLPGMRDQFVCHWQLAEYAQPGKTSWNLEPWRPLVDYSQMLATGCNPGNVQEPF
jgi:hypothetical protein